MLSTEQKHKNAGKLAGQAHSNNMITMERLQQYKIDITDRIAEIDAEIAKAKQRGDIKAAKVLAEEARGLQENLSLIHISEPTRPY